MDKKWLNYFKFLYLYMIFLAKICKTKKPELSAMPVFRDILQQKYIRFKKRVIILGPTVL